MKILLPLIFIYNICTAQVQDVFDVIKQRADVTLHINDTLAWIAKDNARHLIIAYDEDAPEQLQDVVDNFNDSWFNDIDVFLGNDLKEVLSYMQTCTDGFFLAHKGKVVIDVSETYSITVVTIYCIP